MHMHSAYTLHMHYRPDDLVTEPVTYSFRAYALGPFYASACTSLTDPAATVRMCTDHPYGAWQIADEPFASGEPNGHPCERMPETHRHILFYC